ncbi:MAG: hypothetical protein K2M55_07835 [Muribaculaceae bacterium]|nr:hypothetical protein [Muribaculaceae bacterium]
MKITRNYLPYYITLALWTLLFMVAMVIHPRLVDDDWFMQHFTVYAQSGRWSDYLDGVMDMLRVRGAADNLRLFNMLAGALNPLPYGVASIIGGIAAGALLYLSARLAGCWKQSFVAYSVVALSLDFFFPWFESMYTVMFQYNYMCTAAYLLFVVLLMLGERRLNIPVSILLGFIGGVSHEIFGCLLCAAAVILLFYPDRRRSASWVLLGSVAGLFCILVLVPGVATRAEEQLMSINLNPFFMVRGTLHWCMPMYFAWLVYLCLLCRRKYRGQVLSARVVVIMGMSLAAWYIFMVFTGARTGIGLFVCTAIIYGMAASYLFRRGKLWMSIAATVAWCIILVHGIAVIYWTVQLREDCERAEAYIAAGRVGNRFIIRHSGRDMPWWLLDRPHYDSIHTLFFKEGADSEQVPLPVQLESFDPDKAEYIGGNIDAWLWHGMIVALADVDSDDLYSANFQLNTYKGPRYVTAFSRIFECKGRKYRYLIYDAGDFMPALRPKVVSIDHLPPTPVPTGLFNFVW